MTHSPTRAGTARAGTGRTGPQRTDPIPPTRPPGPSALAVGMALACAFLLALGIALGAFSPTAAATPELERNAEAEPFVHMIDPALGILHAAGNTSDDEKAQSSSDEDVLTVEHRVPIGEGRELFVTETFTPASLYRFPRRAMLFLSGSAFRGNHWSIPVEGYDGTAMAARRGFFAYTVDYLGVGESFRPQDGTEVTFEANLEAMETLIRYIRWRRFVPKVDLVGAGYGGSLAAVLAEDRLRVRSTVMSAMLYDVSIGGPLQDPDFVAMLESAPDGYVFLPGEASLIFADDTPQEVLDYVVATQGGTYPAENFLVATRGLPFYDPGAARVPGLILFGRRDALVGADGMDGLALDYGGSGALLVVNESAGHAPRFESPEIASWYWRNTWAFVDPDPLPVGEPAGVRTDGDPWVDTSWVPAAGIPAGIEGSSGSNDPGDPPGDPPPGDPWIDRGTARPHIPAGGLAAGIEGGVALPAPSNPWTDGIDEPVGFGLGIGPANEPVGAELAAGFGEGS
ncbi:MAG: alpha/beta hydrolase [Holophagales bacterium]|nr:alpha/beta hydrolase [Holophagales bacterium]